MQSIDTCKWLEYLLYIQSLGKRIIRLKHIKKLEMEKSNNKIVSKEAPEYDY